MSEYDYGDPECHYLSQDIEMMFEELEELEGMTDEEYKERRGE